MLTVLCRQTPFFSKMNGGMYDIVVVQYHD